MMELVDRVLLLISSETLPVDDVDLAKVNVALLLSDSIIGSVSESAVMVFVPPNSIVRLLRLLTI